MSAENIKEVVKRKYGQVALRVQGGGASCCGPNRTAENCGDPITSNLYSAQQSGDVPEQALQASMGCGNPTALAQQVNGKFMSAFVRARKSVRFAPHAPAQ